LASAAGTELHIFGEGAFLVTFALLFLSSESDYTFGTAVSSQGVVPREDAFGAAGSTVHDREGILDL